MKKIPIIVAIAGLVLVGFAFTSIQDNQDVSSPTISAQSAKVVLYKTATCGCCSKWADHMKESGFDVETKNLSNAALTAVKHQHGVQSKFWSCHTAIVDGYVVEGHVPADQVIKMLEEKPEITGLAVPGMPTGSPGMEVPDKTKYETFNVLAFGKDGSSKVYKKVEPTI